MKPATLFFVLTYTSISTATPQSAEVGVLRRAEASARHAGTLDWATGTWNRSEVALANAAGSQVIYDNTCSFTGGQMFVANEECWDRYDEGRIPTTFEPFDPGGLVCDCYLLCAFEIGYCTSEAPGDVHFQVGFYEGLETSGIGGPCAGFLATGVPPSGNGKPLPPGNGTGPNDLYFDLSNVNLPADPGGGGTQNCWVVTIDLTNLSNGGFRFCGNGGDAVFENSPDTDLFSWVWRQRGTSSAFGATGPLQGGDPIAGASGACSFTQPCPSGCGTGLGTMDLFWINADGVPVGGGGGPNACSAEPSNGSGCYFLGGWPSSPYASLYLRLFSSAAACATGVGNPVPTTYCTAKLSSSGCEATLTSSDPLNQPVSGADDYDVIANQVEGLKAGLFFTGNAGTAQIPFQGGLLCVLPPTARSPTKFSLGSLANCDGQFVQRINGGALYTLDMGPGSTTYVQVWFRDPQLADGFGTALSNAIRFDYL